MEYSITIKELLKRTEIINPAQPFEFLQKMTDDEIAQWEDEVEMKLDLEGPTYEGEDLDMKRIDRNILYELYQKGTEMVQNSLTTAEKYEELLNSGYSFDISNVPMRRDGEWDIRVVWKHVQKPGNRYIASNDGDGFGTLDDCLDDILEYIVKYK